MEEKTKSVLRLAMRTFGEAYEHLNRFEFMDARRKLSTATHLLQAVADEEKMNG